MSPPNILYLHSNDTGRYIQPYGHAIPTPNLQRLAEEGVLFRQAFCAAPTCAPSRAALLTGQCPHSAGMIGMPHRGFALDDPGRLITHVLRAGGYRCVRTGIQHVAEGPDVNRLGYDEVRHGLAAPELDAAAFLDARPAGPFFLDVGFMETHRMGRGFWHAEPEGTSDGRYCLPPAPLPDTPRSRQDMADYKRSAAELDRKYGVVLDALERNGLADDTLVFCTTDHGIAFPLMKCNLTDHGIGVLMIMRGPDGFAGGKVIDAMVSHVDVFPTLCDYLGLDAPSWLQGLSFMPVVRGDADEVNDEVFAEVTYHAAYEPQRAVRTRRWKYIRRYENLPHPILTNCDDGLCKDLMIEHGWRDRPPAEEQLYDLAFDPSEANNLAADPARLSTLEDMRSRLDGWMHRTKDPLLLGHVDAPAGARVNARRGLSPGEDPIPAWQDV